MTTWIEFFKALIVIILCISQIFYTPLSLADELIDEGCTIGVAASSATSDGRPLVWKTRDGSRYDDEVIYITSEKYKFITVINAGQTESAWMGVNEKGFVILDSDVYDLPYEDSGHT